MNSNSSISHKTIFSKKVQYYKQARPSYPAPVFEYLSRLVKPGSKIVEFGCGTGIFTKDLLKYDYEIYAVDPCAEMLTECKAGLVNNNNVHYIESSAEEVILKKSSIDAFIFPQSLHWMNIGKIKKVVAHAANDNFQIITVWNSRNISDTDCSIKYNRIVNTYKKRHPLSIDVQTDPYKLLNNLYGKGNYKIFKCQHTHQLTQQGVEYLFLSISDIDLNAFELDAKTELNSWFDAYQCNGYVPMEYECFMSVSRRI